MASLNQIVLLVCTAVLRSRGKAGLNPALPWQHGAQQRQTALFEFAAQESGRAKLEDELR
jgi:hypothetical protein